MAASSSGRDGAQPAADAKRLANHQRRRAAQPVDAGDQRGVDVLDQEVVGTHRQRHGQADYRRLRGREAGEQGAEMGVPEGGRFRYRLVGGLVDADDHDIVRQRRRCVGAQPARLGIVERLVGEAQRRGWTSAPRQRRIPAGSRSGYRGTGEASDDYDMGRGRRKPDCGAPPRFAGARSAIPGMQSTRLDSASRDGVS